MGEEKAYVLNRYADLIAESLYGIPMREWMGVPQGAVVLGRLLGILG
jgi:hypothetical protein